MRKITLLELIVEWNQLPATDTIAVWVDRYVHDEVSTDAGLWQRGCFGDREPPRSIAAAIRKSGDLTCYVGDDVAPHFGLNTQMYTCAACFRPMSEHLTAKQYREIVAAVEQEALEHK